MRPQPLSAYAQSWSKPGRENVDPDQVGHQISRRRMLKRIGAGAAVAWTAPVLTSIRTSAFGQSCARGGCCDSPICRGRCGSPCAAVEPCGTNKECWCLTHASTGTCLCGTIDCNGPPCPGRSDSECPEGTCCIDNCCGPLTCSSPCGGAGVRSGKSSGLRATK